jgi:hypothetical protein
MTHNPAEAGRRLLAGENGEEWGRTAIEILDFQRSASPIERLEREVQIGHDPPQAG